MIDGTRKRDFHARGVFRAQWFKLRLRGPSDMKGIKGKRGRHDRADRDSALVVGGRAHTPKEREVVEAGKSARRKWLQFLPFTEWSWCLYRRPIGSALECDYSRSRLLVEVDTVCNMYQPARSGGEELGIRIISILYDDKTKGNKLPRVSYAKI